MFIYSECLKLALFIRDTFVEYDKYEKNPNKLYSFCSGIRLLEQGGGITRACEPLT